MGKKEVLLAVDMGGTNIKSALFSLDKKILSPIFSFPACSGDKTIERFKESIISLFRTINEYCSSNEFTFSKIGISSPGPFNYKTGESLMTHKYGFLEHMNVGDFISKTVGLTNVVFKYVHDVNSFLYGAIEFYGWKKEKVMGATIGTGLGAAIYDGHSIINNDMDEPIDARFYKEYKGILFEDFCSGRGIVNKAKTVGLKVETSLDVYNLAKEGNQQALDVFKFFGHMLKEALVDRIFELDISRILIGGAVSGSKEFFVPTLKNEIKKDIDVVVPENQEILTLIGALIGF